MTKNFDNSLNESLSALLDGECSENELERLLDAIEAQDGHLYASAANSESTESSDSSLRETWKRYHAIQQVTQKGGVSSPELLKVDLSASIASAIAQESASVIAPAAVGRWASWKPLRDFAGKTAVAASVAVAFVAGVQFMQSGDQPAGEILAEQGAPAAQMPGANVPQGFELPPLTARTVSAGEPSNNARVTPLTNMSGNAGALPSGSVMVRNSEMDEFINRLLVKHAEQSATSGAIGVTPYARVSNLEGAEEHSAQSGDAGQ